MSSGRFIMADGTARPLASASRRPPEPSGSELRWYRGWECGYDSMAAFWTPEGWSAYKGGCDLDAPHITAATWNELLDAIDEEEDDA